MFSGCISCFTKQLTVYLGLIEEIRYVKPSVYRYTIKNIITFVYTQLFIRDWGYTLTLQQSPILSR